MAGEGAKVRKGPRALLRRQRWAPCGTFRRECALAHLAWQIETMELLPIEDNNFAVRRLIAYKGDNTFTMKPRQFSRNGLDA